VDSVYIFASYLFMHIILFPWTFRHQILHL